MVVTDLFGELKGYITPKPFKTDSFLFWFFYRATVGVHVLFAILLGLKAYFGDPIDCVIRKTEVRSDVIDNYCWVTGTWTVQDKEAHEIETNSVRRKVRNE